MSVDDMAAEAGKLRTEARGLRHEIEDLDRIADDLELRAELLERKIASRSVVGVQETLRMFREAS